MSENFPDIKSLSVIIPCFNEEGNVHRFEKELIQELKKLNLDLEFIFVDDGSTDRTYPLLQNLQERHPRIKIIRHLENLGLGAAIRSGFEASSGEAVLTIDADLTFHPDQTPLLLKELKGDVVCVIGSAFLGHMDKVSAFRKFLSQSVNAVYSSLWGQKLTSTSSVFRIYRNDAIKKIRFHSNSFDVNAEILYRLFKKDSHVVEVPVTLTSRSHGKSKINVLREIKNHLKMFMRIISWRLRRVR